MNRLISEAMTSIHPQRLEHGIHRIGIEAGLELGEQFAGDAGDVGDAAHGQQDAFGAGVEGYLQGVGEVAGGAGGAAQGHVAEDDELALHGAAECG